MKLKNKVALLYKVFLYCLLISQIILFFMLNSSWISVINLVLIIYFSLRIHVFLKVERLAKNSGMSILDYMKRFEKDNPNF